MHKTLVIAALLATGPAVAQAFYIPNSDPTSGAACNVIPLGGTLTSATWVNQKYQTLVTAAQLANTPGIITGLGFAACGTGYHTWGTIEVWMSHFQGNQLSTTFAQNLDPNAIQVLNATNYTWHTVASTWNELGLMQFFPYNGVDNLVIEITVTASDWVGSGGAAHRRETEPRLYAVSWVGSPPASGTGGNAALKMEITMLEARTSIHGLGCAGSNGTPEIGFTGLPQIGMPFAFDLQNGVPNNIAFLATGVGNGAPFPQNLGTFGLPNCFAYFNVVSAVALPTDAAGSASLPINIPNSAGLLGTLLFAQWAPIDPGAGGFTTSTYGRVLVGN